VTDPVAPVDTSRGEGGGAVHVAVRFGRLLRLGGLPVSTDSVLAFVDALACLDAGRRSEVYWAGRATLVRRPEDIPTFDRAFAAFWDDARATDDDGAAEDPTDEAPEEVVLAVDGDDDLTGGPPGDVPDDVLSLRYSSLEVLRRRDFAELSEDELRDAQRLMASLRMHTSERRSPRLVPSRRSGRPDVRATVRAALRTGGEPIERRWRRPGRRPRRLVLLLDVSGSMEPYARGLLRFVHVAVAGRGSVEAFAIGTRLTRVTADLRSRDPDAAFTAAARRVPDWSGGTRLGETLRTFNDRWGVRGMARGAVVVLLSDGWDRGDPDVLAEQLRRLRRVCHRLVWVNPLKVTPGYAPLARGMAAALPLVDDFVEGHNIEAMERLASLVAQSR